MYLKKSRDVLIDTEIAFFQILWPIGLITSFQDLPTFENLKKHIISLIRPPPKDTFAVFNPPLLRYLFQLRVGLSRLRSHKKRHNFADTPSDLCLCKNGVEDTHHYLFNCPFFASHRKALLSTVVRDKNLNVNSVDLLLYGDPSLSTAENQTIICATLDYIDKTNRLTSWTCLYPPPAICFF